MRVGKYLFDRKSDRNQIVIIRNSLQCARLIKLQYMTYHTLKIREIKLDPSHYRKSKMDAYTFKKLEKRTIEKRCSLLIFKNGRAK